MIAINGRFLGRRTTGVDRFAREVVWALDQAIVADAAFVKGLAFEILLPPGSDCDMELRAIPIRRVGRFSGQLWEQIDLPRAASGALLLNLCNTGPAFLRNQIVVIHDALSVRQPEAFNWRARLWYKLLIPRLASVAKRVLTVSEFSKREIISCFGVPAQKIQSIQEGSEHLLRIPTDVSAIRRFELANRPYALCVSSSVRYKNLSLLPAALAKLDAPSFDMAIAGGSNRVFRDVDAAALANVNHLGYVNDAELRALYENAMCFVFPSLYEGFGLPVVEAMSLGCPVIASNAASLPEVCAEAALMIDPADPASLAQALKACSGDPELRKKLSERGRERARALTWNNTARQIADACREFVAADAAPGAETGSTGC